MVVKKEEEQALAKAQETEEIKNSAQRDLDEALPALVRTFLLLQFCYHNAISSIDFSDNYRSSGHWHVD